MSNPQDVAGSSGTNSPQAARSNANSPRTSQPQIAQAAGSPQQGSPKQGTPKQGTPKQGTPKQGTPQQATPQQGTPHHGSPPSKSPRTSLGTPSSFDILATEFVYYGAVLKNYVSTLSREYDKVTSQLWIRKLFKPEYHSTVLKPKRNKYLLFLTITLYNDETYGIFRQEPPSGVLPEINELEYPKELATAAWENEKQWEEALADIPDELKFTDCYLHNGSCPDPQFQLNAILDANFQFYLWMARPYIALISDPEDKTVAACWVQLLCGIAPEEGNCTDLKELRNEYMQAFLGYIHDLRIEGPFRRMPILGPIPPLGAWYAECLKDPRFQDTSEREAEQFLQSQPHPDSGAFAYINVTGEIFGNHEL